MPGKDTNIGAKRAREARDAIAVDALAPIPDLLGRIETRLAIPVNVTSMPEGLAGLCWQRAGETVLWLNAHQLASRRRFTLAHELGHVMCGHRADLRMETFRTLSGRVTTNIEVQANAFAAELLAPAQGVRRHLRRRQPTLEVVLEISAHFGVSALVAAYRLVTLGLADRSVAESLEDPEHHDRTDIASAAPWDDVTRAAKQAPRISPLLAGCSLRSLLHGGVTVHEAASQLAVAPELLRLGLALISA